MSLVKLAHFCSHMQNCTRVNLPLAHIPLTKLHLQVSLGLYKHGFISSIQRGSILGPDQVPTEVTPDNIATRRLWLGLKYKDSKSVLRQMSLISKPNRRLYLNEEQIKLLASGLKVRLIEPLQPGEVMFVRTPSGEVLELQDVARRNLKGEVLCRAR